MERYEGVTNQDSKRTGCSSCTRRDGIAIYSLADTQVAQALEALMVISQHANTGLFQTLPTDCSLRVPVMTTWPEPWRFICMTISSSQIG